MKLYHSNPKVLDFASSQRFSFDLVTTCKDLLIPPEEHVSRCHVVQRFVIPMVVVVFDPLRDRLLKFPWIIVVFQLDHVLHRTVIAFDLALCHRVIGRTPGVFHTTTL